MLINLPNLRHLRAFHELSQKKRINLACKKICISQSAMTQAIAKLENQIGSPLFLRTPDGMLLTESGQILFTRIERCLNLLHQGLRDAIRCGNGKSRHPQNQVTNTQLRALIALENNQTFTLAAKSISISQPALYRSARELEDQLNITLFEKTNLGISLTKAAITLARYVRLAYSEWRQANEEINGLLGMDSSAIIIGSMPLARTYILPMAINQLTNKFPNTSINVIDGPYEDLLRHLNQGDIDFLIGALRGQQSTQNTLIEETLFSTELSIIARSNHPLFKDTNMTMTDLAQHHWIVPRKNTPSRNRFDRLFLDQNLAIPSGLIECSSQNLMRHLLLGSDRLGFISEHQFKLEIDKKVLAIIPFEIPHSSRPIGLTYRKNWHPTSTQKALLNHLGDFGKTH